MTVKKLGIIGGSFDPIHIGHLNSAEFVYKALGLDKVLFVPAYIAPHKIGMEFAAAELKAALILRSAMWSLSAAAFPILTIRCWS